MGLDEIHLRVLRELAEVIAETLSIIYQRSLLMGEVPEDWRLANVTVFWDLTSLLGPHQSTRSTDR